jgi:mRNA interferase RelE/StbE
LIYKLLFDDKVARDLKAIDKTWQRKILDAIHKKLSSNPYIGKRLVGELSPYYRLRIGDYRVIYEIHDQQLIVLIIKVRHRKDVYK